MLHTVPLRSLFSFKALHCWHFYFLFHLGLQRSHFPLFLMQRDATDLQKSACLALCLQPAANKTKTNKIWYMFGGRKETVSVRELGPIPGWGVATDLRDVRVACVTSQRADIPMFQLEILSEKRSSQKEGLLFLW